VAVPVSQSGQVILPLRIFPVPLQVVQSPSSSPAGAPPAAARGFACGTDRRAAAIRPGTAVNAARSRPAGSSAVPSPTRSARPAATASSAVYHCSPRIWSRHDEADPRPERSAYTLAMLSLTLSRVSAICRISAALPTVMPNASWIIIIAPGCITRSWPDWAITEAIDAARPSTVTVTGPLWERIAFPIAMPSKTSPPPEFTCTSSAPLTPESCAAKLFAVRPSLNQPPSPMSS
jgi:hypothetical protein